MYSGVSGPKHKKSEPRLVLTRMRPDENGNLVAVQSNNTESSRWDKLGKGDPGYSYDVSLLRASRKGASPTHARVTFKEQRFSRPSERFISPDDWATPDTARPKNLPAVITDDPNDTEVMDRQTMLARSNAASKERTRSDRHRLKTKIGAWLGI